MVGELLFYQLGKVLTYSEFRLLNHITTPHTMSQDEWSQAFMNLSQLVIEGFVTKAIKHELDSESVAYNTEGSLILLEMLLVAKSLLPKHEKLEGLKATNLIRTKVRAHTGSTQAKKLADDALRSHGTFTNHFRYVCGTIAKELHLIEQALNPP